jgi:hypothetical protein
VLAGGVLISKNYKMLGDNAAATKSQVSSFVAVVLLIALSLAARRDQYSEQGQPQ